MDSPVCSAKEELILLSVVESLALEVALDAHWLIKTGQMDMDSLYDLRPIVRREPPPPPAPSSENGTGTAVQRGNKSGNTAASQQRQASVEPEEFMCNGHILVNTADGVYRRNSTGELRKVHGNSRLHPNHQSNRGPGGEPHPFATIITPTVTSPAPVTQKGGNQNKKQLNAQQRQENENNSSIGGNGSNFFPYNNSLEQCTVYSSGYISAYSGYGTNKQQSLDSRLIARCPVCYQPVAGSRFASHLERCLNGGGRVTNKGLSSHGSGSGTSNLGLGLGKSKGPFVDPHPTSSIVRIRVNTTGPTIGQPKVYQDREGVSEKEWNEALKNSVHT
jgi:hypothetical protein